MEPVSGPLRVKTKNTNEFALENKRRNQAKQPERGPQTSGEGPVQPSLPVITKSLAQRFVGRITGALITLAALVLLEFALRLVGYGYPARFFIHHKAAGPDRLVENSKFARRFMPLTLVRRPEPMVVSPRKEENTCRIFVFGESAAIGDPAPAFGFSRILDVLLNQRYPSLRFEVINVAFTAINSHVLLEIARDCKNLGGDFWLIYMGNNEVIGPFGSGTVFSKQSPPLPVIRASVAIKSTRTGQLMDSLAQQFVQSTEAHKGWGGMDMFLENQVRRDDPRLNRLYAHFAKNLGQIISMGTNSGAKVIVSTMVSNLRDWPPFSSMHRPGLGTEQLKEWEALYGLGIAAEKNGHFDEAIRNYTLAAKIDGEFAELHFRLARCYLAKGNPAEAKTHFVLARDLDTLRFRTDSRLNELIRQVASACPTNLVRLIDAENEFNARSPNQIVGNQFLYEHVHFTFAGNYLLAKLFAEQIAKLLGAPKATNGMSASNWLSEPECALRLAYTDTQRYEIANLLLRRFEEPIYRRQLEHSDRIRRQQQEVAELRNAAKPTARRRGLDACRQALATRPNDWVLHDLCARLSLALAEYDQAELEWREVARLIPHSPKPYTEIGKLKLQLGKLDEALIAFQTAVKLDRDFADAHAGLGTAYARTGNRNAAVHHLRKAVKLDPTQHAAARELSRILQWDRN